MRPPMARRVLAASIAIVLSGCTGAERAATSDPLADMRNAELPVGKRADAVGRAWEAAAEPADRAVLRPVYKDLAWQAGIPSEVRRRIMDLLINDPDPGAAADARQMVRLMLPREPSRAMMAYLCEVIASRRWTECAPNLVRSYARFVPEVPDPQRAEAIALRALFPDRDLESLVFDVFLNPPDDTPPAASAGTPLVDWTERTRADAWDLLARLDTEGTRRAALITGTDEALGAHPAVAMLRRCRAELRCVPLTGDELKWLRALADPSHASNRAWWEESSRAARSLTGDQASRLALRHLEAVRWAAAQRPSWLAATREDLLGELGRRLDAREHRDRGADKTSFRQAGAQTLDHWRDHLRWGDLLAALVIDEAVHDPLVLAALGQQAEVDRRDTSTEYGGILEWTAVPGAFRATLFPPRPGQREGDERFVASDDLVAASDRALAQYHFHAQRVRNESFAGPSRADVQYAARCGRACVVVTSVGRGVFNLDYYQPDGVVLDLGDVRAGGS